MTTKINNTRYTGGISHEECATELLLNPFVHRLELETTYEKIKVRIFLNVILGWNRSGYFYRFRS